MGEGRVAAACWRDRRTDSSAAAISRSAGLFPPASSPARSTRKLNILR